MIDPHWNDYRRGVLKGALRKAQAAQMQHEQAKLDGREGLAIYQAAQAWDDMMTMLDERAQAGALEAVRPSNVHKLQMVSKHNADGDHG